MSATRRELLEERWRVATSRPLRFKNEAGISNDNSKDYYRAERIVHDLAARLVDEVSDDEMEGLDRVWQGIWLNVEQTLLAWAEQTEEAREARRAA